MIIRVIKKQSIVNYDIIYIPGESFYQKKVELINNPLLFLNKEFPIIPVGTDEIVETRKEVTVFF